MLPTVATQSNNSSILMAIGAGQFLSKATQRINMMTHAMTIQARMDKKKALELSHEIGQYNRNIQSFVNAYRFSNESEREAFQINDDESIKKAVDAAYWKAFYTDSNLGSVLDPKSRMDWEKSVTKDNENCPEFNYENVESQVKFFMKDAHEIIVNRAIETFRKLSREHKTNSSFGFREKLIFDNCSSSIPTNIYENKSGYVHELRCLIALVKGDVDIPTTKSTEHLLNKIFTNPGEWVISDNFAFEIKGFRKRTVHIKIEPEVAEQLNDLLAEAYPNCLPDSTSKEIHKEFKSRLTPEHRIIRHAVRDIISRVTVENPRIKNTGPDARQRPLIQDTNNNHVKLTTYHFKCASELNAVNEAVHIISESLGTNYKLSDNGKEYIWEMGSAKPWEVLKHLSVVGELPEASSHQFYESTSKVRVSVGRTLKKLGLTDTSECLEPSAGRGALASLLPRNYTTCVDINALNVAALKMRGYNVLSADFLTYAVSAQKQYDFIVMNPPWYRRTYLKHVMAAMPLLKAGGNIIAVIPSSYDMEKLNHYSGFQVTEIERFKDTFKGTGELEVAVISITRCTVM
ncbi:DUF4942 domain-containing protein [Vibrio sp. Y2-5]|uniref:DUF4942 domain-containing protein n=1 Tax=Vibrio sp. Y2-5 TaxID=2743977 RepID=UPI00166121F3|nr:DUF4942 domain-containing protein [Vibrio sp. Y2-5]MBD0788192.1 DUF4942 domain-containing protein [Vibrio sp. Y2-5]